MLFTIIGSIMANWSSGIAIIWSWITFACGATASTVAFGSKTSP
jgi:hypothetical protein